MRPGPGDRGSCPHTWSLPGVPQVGSCLRHSDSRGKYTYVTSSRLQHAMITVSKGCLSLKSTTGPTVGGGRGGAVMNDSSMYSHFRVTLPKSQCVPERSVPLWRGASCQGSGTARSQDRAHPHGVLGTLTTSGLSSEHPGPLWELSAEIGAETREPAPAHWFPSDHRGGGSLVGLRVR